ncbi:hypothetical protein LCGC14_2704300 [marine sediment metagenome]|uniref:Uncharacterized protein n=1 Tax=marine sediment metagenome TaxID=412755 RepID=A0A0F8ZEP6_9ZZZZ
MQTLTGKIVSVQPTADGGYNGTNGWINTFTMTIQGPNAQVTGEIGSKSSPYPLTAGQEITVTAEQTQYGLKFKKINPQYSGRGQHGGGQANPEKEERIMRGNALNAVMSAANIMPDEIENYLMAGVNFIKSGVWGLSQQQEPIDLSNPAPMDDGSDIPF